MMTIEEKKENVIDVFNEIAERYVEYYGEDWEFKDDIDIFISKVIPNGRVLDIGSGSGYISKYITDNGLRCEGIDICNKMIEISKTKYPIIFNSFILIIYKLCSQLYHVLLIINNVFYAKK